MKKSLLIVAFLLTLNIGLLSSIWRVSGEFELHMLNIGQGDAILLVTPDEHHILVDGGPGRSVLMELAATVPYLFNEIDLLVLTHPHLDHMEGLVEVLKRFEVKAVLMGFPDYESEVNMAFLQELDVPIYVAEAGRDFVFGEVFLDVLYPFEPISGEMENVNNASPVIMVHFGDERILLTGDAEHEVEEKLLAAGVDLRADILKAGHHGSRTSSTLEVLEAVGPEIMLISAGEDNSYGHPHEETLQKAAELGIEVRRTDLEGRISLYFSP